MKNLLFILLFPVVCYGQGDQTIITVPIDASGTTFQAILHLPNDYTTTNTAYPLMMFFHGVGEGGPNPASIYTSSTAGGPAYFIAQGTFPSSFVNPKDGKSYKYIVVSPQAYPGGAQGSTTAQELDFILTYLYAHYRVDTTRVYLTGLSDGGETAVEYPGGVMSNSGNFLRFNRTHRIAATIPMSENGMSGLIPEQADSITAENIGAWGFGSTDEQGQNTLQLAWYCNQITAGWMLTTSYVGGHCCWGQFYDPTFTQNGMSIYQWALQYQYTSPSGSAPVTVPVANGGSAQTIQLPTTQTTLSGAASTVTNGTIMKYAWTQQSGPSKAVIADSTAVATPVTGLTTPGVNVFALQITDNTGKTSTATVPVTVTTAAAAGYAIPGEIQSEDYSSMSGVATQTTTDTGGGLDVGWIDKGDWMDYAVDAATAGNYTVNFRVATLYPGATFQVKNASGTVLATVALPVTGGYQTWATISAVINLPAGSQTLQLYSTSTINWNINWMEFTGGGSTPLAIPGTIKAASYSSMSGVATQTTTDSGGGLNVGWIDKGDWMDYAVDVAAAGNYTVNFRVATLYPDAAFQVKNASGTVLATVALPVTGGYQTWATISAVVNLPAGDQTLQLYSTSTINWNINWMEFITDTASAESLAVWQSSTLDSAAASFTLYPNPVGSTFTVAVGNAHTGNMIIQVIDASGAVRKTLATYKDQSPRMVNIAVADLPRGIYFVRVQVGGWSAVKKMMKS